MHQELAAMRAAYEELTVLDPAAQIRAVRWLGAILTVEQPDDVDVEAALAEAQAAGLVDAVAPAAR